MNKQIHFRVYLTSRIVSAAAASAATAAAPAHSALFLSPLRKGSYLPPVSPS